MDDELIARFVENEGIRKSAYQDSLGYWTIGIGVCIDARKGLGLTTEECFYLLKNRLVLLKQSLSAYDWFARCNETRQGVLIEMAYNLGVSGLLGFKKTIAFIENFQYAGAAKEMANSRWAGQIGSKRLKDLQARMSSGRY